MPQSHGDHNKKKPSGGRKKAMRGKRAHEMGGAPAATIVGDPRPRERRGRGGSRKMALLAANVANVLDPNTGKTEKSKIQRVVKNTANVDYERRGVITKGSVILTALGQAKVVSRPGQDGVVNAILTQKAQ